MGGLDGDFIVLIVALLMKHFVEHFVKNFVENYIPITFVISVLMK